MTASAKPTVLPAVEPEPDGAFQWLFSTDHKRIGLLAMGTALVLFFAMGALALVMRAQLAQPDQHILSAQQYNQFFTLHGTGMISLVVTPFAIAFGVYLIPLQIGAPAIAAPRLALLGFWLYLFGALALIWAFLTPGGAAASWWSYPPLSDAVFSPEPGQDLWIVGVCLAAIGMMLLAGTVLWTVFRMRAPGVTMMRLPVFAWTQVITCLMVLASFSSLLAALGVLVAGGSTRSCSPRTPGTWPTRTCSGSTAIPSFTSCSSPSSAASPRSWRPSQADVSSVIRLRCCPC